jgi:hypothetical protein
MVIDLRAVLSFPERQKGVVVLTFTIIVGAPCFGPVRVFGGVMRKPHD